MNILRVGNGVGVPEACGPGRKGYTPIVAYANILAKRGAEPLECEDRLAWYADPITGEVRAAVADGASASLFAGEWAELLATAYCDSADRFDASLVDRLSRDWQAMVRERPLPWYAQAKAAHGAFAALVGVTLHPDGAWSVLTVGDSCAFLVRQGMLVSGYPTDRAGDFGRSPILLGTATAVVDDLMQRHTEALEPGDDVFLMTDALAAWALAELAAGRDPWNWMEALESTQNPLPFDQWINDMREAGRLQNDDVSLLHLKVGGAEL